MYECSSQTLNSYLTILLYSIVREESDIVFKDKRKVRSRDTLLSQ